MLLEQQLKNQAPTEISKKCYFKDIINGSTGIYASLCALLLCDPFSSIVITRANQSRLVNKLVSHESIMHITIRSEQNLNAIQNA